MVLPRIKYIIISPVRNEESNIEKTVLSVISQTLKPFKWIIVDDGSSDKTVEIIKKYTKTTKWISLLELDDRGYYDLMSGGEIKAFYRGYDHVKDLSYDFIAKLDGDISFNEYYFENLFKQFHLNEKLGIAGGTCYSYNNKKLLPERVYKYHVRGAARVYRLQCWKDIDGTIDELGWDAIDVYRARMLGWETRSFPEIKMIHHVKTWVKGGIFRGRMRSARMEYLMGTHPLFFLLKLIREIFKKPFLISFFAFSLGYFKPLFKGDKRVVDKKLMAYIRKEQMKRLFLFW